MMTDNTRGQVPSGRSPWLIALMFLVPYFLLMMSWTFSTAPGGGPDERDHLVKALGMSSLSIGTPYPAAPPGASLIRQRNASIARVIPVPAQLNPVGFSCEAGNPNKTAACLPESSTASSGLVGVPDPLGSYPPFLYLPVGVVAGWANTPAEAFLLARLFCALTCSVLMFFGAAHLVRWLGRKALLGAFIGLTPMLVFCSAIVSTSGFEICSAFGVVCVVVVALRRPESLQQRGTQILLAMLGATLMLSRQLGIVTFSLLMVLLVVRVGWRFFRDLIRRPTLPLIAAIVVLVLCAGAVTVWERRYDHPSLTGSPVSQHAFGGFVQGSYHILESAVARFGNLDVVVPPWFIAAWIVLFVMLFGAAVMVGTTSDRWTLLGWFVAMLITAYVAYATVFFPIGAAIQGRHVLAFFILLPVLAGVIVVERFDEFDPRVTRRFFVLTAVAMPTLQAAAIYITARRYAVGAQGPVWFLGSSQWRPAVGGFAPWFATAVIGAVALLFTILRAGGSPQAAAWTEPPVETELASVEG